MSIFLKNVFDIFGGQQRDRHAAPVPMQLLGLSFGFITIHEHKDKRNLALVE